MAQWLRICLPMQGTRVRALVREDPTCRGATRSVSHNYWACASGACAPQQERPQQWKARAPQWRVSPACHNWRKPSHRNEDQTQPKIKNKLIKTKKTKTKTKKHVGKKKTVEKGRKNKPANCHMKVACLYSAEVAKISCLCFVRVLINGRPKATAYLGENGHITEKPT